MAAPSPAVTRIVAMSRAGVLRRFSRSDLDLSDALCGYALDDDT